MIPYWSLDGSQLYQGNVLDVLRALAAGSVHMVATSPPYYGLRNYQLPPVEWPAVSYAPMAGLAEIEIAGCDPGCAHEWGEPIIKVSSGGPPESQGLEGGKTSTQQGAGFESSSQFCHLCGGWRGCLGLEPTVEMFVGHIVLIWRELKRVLRDDGTCWLNLGDSYATNPGNGRGGESVDGGTPHRSGKDKTGGLPAKNLIGVPWRVAFALQADGWYLRSDIIWAKGLSFCAVSGSCMPESVTDRPTNSYEHVFLLAKSKSYFYDGDAVRESLQPGTMARAMRGVDSTNKLMPGAPGQTAQSLNLPRNHGEGYGGINPAGRNLRTVWAINPGSYAGAHFATFPPALVEPMIKAGTSERGCCPSCGAQWKRVVGRACEQCGTFIPVQGKQCGQCGYVRDWKVERSISDEFGTNDWSTPGRGTPRKLGSSGHQGPVPPQEKVEIGFRPTCTCGTEYPIPQEELDADPTLLDDFEIEPFPPVPCTILDPFAGSGTALIEAIKLGRRAIGVELSKEYCDDHIIPRLSEPLLEWALLEWAEKQDEPDPEPIQLELL